jgi:hypothetical protein
LALGWTDDDVVENNNDNEDDIARMPITATLGIEREAIAWDLSNIVAKLCAVVSDR